MISGKLLRDAIINGAVRLEKCRHQVDELNVYPVPDGDTGTNMSMTINAAKKELLLLGDDVTVSKAADTAASAMLRGARGNSGVILSILFRGLSKGFKDLETAECVHFSNALELGTEAAYKAVMKPAEGTILTVARLASQAARMASNSTNEIKNEQTSENEKASTDEQPSDTENASNTEKIRCCGCRRAGTCNSL